MFTNSTRRRSRTMGAFYVAASLLGCIASDTMAQTASHPIGITDIVGVRKIGRVAISPDGDWAAYLVIQAMIQKDAYSIKLVVTSARNTSRHDVIAQIIEPATRTPMS